jgi:N-acetylglucosamine-6-phosphate deacetylase
MEYLISASKIYTTDGLLNDATLHIKNGKIIEIYKASQAPPKLEIKNFPKNYSIVPGFIDMHIHGSKGADTMDATPEALQTIADSLLTQGTTGFLASTMTAPAKNIEAALLNLKQFHATQKRGAKLLGVHLEGPFISPDYLGAQKNEGVIEPSIELFKHWQTISGNLIKMVTIAPEQKGGLELVRYLKEHSVIASLGHSGANFEDAQSSIEAGVTHATHLFNAMCCMHHREPGAITALLLSKKVYAELIADGLHLSQGTMQLVYKMKTADRIILITDAMRAQCVGEGVSELGGQTVIVKNGEARLKNGALAGSIITLPKAMHHMMNATHCSLEDIIKMVSTNPADQLNLPHKGRIEKNADADLVVLTDKLKVFETVR